MEASGIDQRELCSLRHSPGEDQRALEAPEAGSTQVVSTFGNGSGSSRGGGVSPGSPRDVHRSQARSFASSYFDGKFRSGFNAKQRLPSDTRNAYAEMRKVYIDGAEAPSATHSRGEDWQEESYHYSCGKKGTRSRRHSHCDKSLHPDAVTSSHHTLLQDVLGSVEAARDSLGFSYRHGFSGFSARLPNVLSVFPNKIHTVHTTLTSWEFLGLYGNGQKSLYGASEATESSWLWRKAKFGKDIIIGVLDSGARFFTHGLQDAPEAYVKAHQEVLSPRDVQGYGTHVTSTAGGRFVRNANWFGYAKGTAKGGAPDSCLAIYKVYWRNVTASTVRCENAHILSAFDMGIHDGVDIISASFGGSAGDYFLDSTSIGVPCHAERHCGGGFRWKQMAGLGGKCSPLIITVGASTLDRAYFADLFLGNNDSFQGSSFTRQRLSKRWYHLAAGADVGLPTSNFPARFHYTKFLELVELALKILEMRFFLQFMLMKELDKPFFHISSLQAQLTSIPSHGDPSFLEFEEPSWLRQRMQTVVASAIRWSLRSSLASVLSTTTGIDI
ncbi:hypothetical protein SELMODRAFT_425831 [Selaginella moellendorffii]|uniref:Uncharacterized protein n=1 Tax=Selaginella moellendorffii TaxID=88036 RepID=D8SUF7_SELML|nr:hypothetical protein SELMODRAFT_425831 [Selaginella moellendorffii]